MAHPLRLGLLGTGVAARELYLPALKELKSRVTLAACANRTRAKAEAFAKSAGVVKVVDTAEELIALPEVDAVLISLPIDQQPQYVLQALRASKPVLSEKPVGPNLREGKRLVKAAAHLGVPWLVGENFAFMQQVTRFRSWLKAGRIGRVRLVEAIQINKMDRQNPYFNTAWRANPRHVGGFVVDGGVHVANVVRRCFGMPVKHRGFVACFDPKLPPIDTAVASLVFENGALGTWTSCFSAPYEGPMLRAYGDRGSAEVHGDKAILRLRNGKETVFIDRENSFTREFRHFADVVQKGTPLVVRPEDALLDLALVEALSRATP